MNLLAAFEHGPVTAGNATYRIDELKYYEKIDRTKRQLLIAGWLFDSEQADAPIAVSVRFDGKEQADRTDFRMTKEILMRQDVCDMYGGKRADIGFRVLLETERQLSDLAGTIEVCVRGSGAPLTVLSVPTDETALASIHVENVHYMIDQFALNGTTIRMAGWGYLSDLYEEYRPLSVWAETDGQTVGRAEYMLRPDIISLFHAPEDAKRQWGFFLLLDLKEHPTCEIRFGETGCFAAKRVDLEELRREKREKKRRYRNKWEMWALADPMQRADDRYYKANLSREEYRALMERRLRSKDVDYDIWIRRHRPTARELERQKKVQFPVAPKISIAVPAYRTPEKFLREMVASVQAQTYPNWELCIADGSLDGSLTPILTELADADERIRFLTLDQNYGISGNTNEALKLATGEYLALLDHDDVLTEDALFMVVSGINETGADCLYSDEDKVDFGLEDYFEPHFKPDFNPDMLHSCNYISHFFAVRRDVFDRAGYFRPEYDGSQDFDFILRCTSEAKTVHHIPKMLYHWRSHAASTAMNPENKMYCYTAGRAAILSDLTGKGYAGAMVGNYTRLGYYEPFYPLEKEPLVSVFTRAESLKRLKEKEAAGLLYPNTELLILGKDALSAATGEYLLFLDGIFLDGSERWIERLLSNALRPEVGAIGGMVYNELGRISSSGKIIRRDGRLLDLFRGLLKEEPGYAAHALMQQDVSVVSMKCLMIARATLNDAGGLPEGKNGIECAALLCQKLLEQGKLVVYTPFVQVKEKEAPEPEDILVPALATGKSDPHYHPSFDEDGEAFTLSL